MNKINTLHLFSDKSSHLFVDYFLKEQEVLLEHRAFTSNQQSLFFGVLFFAKPKESQKAIWLHNEIYFEQFGKIWPLGILRLIQFCKKHRIHAVTTYDEPLGLLLSGIAPLLGHPLLVHHPLAPLRGFFAGWPKAFLGRRVSTRGYVDGPLLRFLNDRKGFEAPLFFHPDTFQNAREIHGTATPNRVIFEIECLYTQTFLWRKERQFLLSTLQQAIPQIRRKFRKSLFRFQKPHRHLRLAPGELKVSIFLCRHFPNEKVLGHLLHCLKIGKPFLVFSEEIYPSIWREKFEPLLYPLEKEVCETVLAETIATPTDLFSLLEKTKIQLTTPCDFGAFLEKSAYQTQVALEHSTTPHLAQLHRQRQTKNQPQPFSDEDFFSLLRCPRCTNALTPHVTHRERNLAWTGHLHCQKCDGQFPILRGIPQLLVDPSENLDNPPWTPEYRRIALFRTSPLSPFEQNLVASLNPLATDCAQRHGIGLHLHTGDGVLMEHLAFFGGRFIGVDLPENLARCQNTLRDFANVRLVAAEPHQLPFVNQAFSLMVDVNALWDGSENHLAPFQKHFFQLSNKLIAETGRLHLLSFAPPAIPRSLRPYWDHLRLFSETLPPWLQKTLAWIGAHGQNLLESVGEKPAGRLPLLKALWLGMLQSSEFYPPDEKCFRDLSRQARLHAVDLQHTLGHLSMTARR